MAFYVESADRPNESAVASEDIVPGEALIVNSNDKAQKFEGQNHTKENYTGVADNPFTGDQIREHDEDTGTYPLYDASEDERVVFGGDADRDRVRVRTAKDTGGNEPTPDISHGDTVGFIDTSAGTLSSTSEYEGRIVEEGYTDGESSPTTYNRSNGNFVALGNAYRDGANAYDDAVRIEVRKDA